jgi:hypothetical protein
MQRWLCLGAFVVGCSGGAAKPVSNTAAPTAANTAEETGKTTACTRNEDCYCRVFNGAEFSPGREPSACCLTAGCNDAVGEPVSQGHCMSCFYD